MIAPIAGSSPCRSLNSSVSCQWRLIVQTPASSCSTSIVQGRGASDPLK
jgi:hypothetical protein